MRDSLNRTNPNSINDALRKIRFGDFLMGQTIQARRAVNMDLQGVSAYNVATLDTLVLPDLSKAALILRATSRAGGVTGELTIVAYGTTPTAGQIAVAPNGNIVTLGSDAVTDLDIVYAPERGDVIDAVFPVVSGVLTLPTTGAYARKPILLLEAEGIEGSVLGKKIVLTPGTTPATLQARLNVAKTQVLFNSGTDALTRARVKMLVAPAFDFQAIVTSSAAELI